MTKTYSFFVFDFASDVILNAVKNLCGLISCHSECSKPQCLMANVIVNIINNSVSVAKLRNIIKTLRGDNSHSVAIRMHSERCESQMQVMSF